MSEEKVQIALLQKEVEDLTTDIKELKTLVQGLVDAWTTATGLLKFVKILGVIGVGASAIWFLGFDILKKVFASV